MKLRRWILTDSERRRLNRWLTTGEEDKTLLNLFTAMRKDFPRLRDDMLLMIKVIKKLRSQDRWSRRLRGSGSASPFGESG